MRSGVLIAVWPLAIIVMMSGRGWSIMEVLEKKNENPDTLIVDGSCSFI